jgi:L-arabinokinase
MLKNWEGGHQAQSLGKLMLQSHESYSECGLGSPDTDLLVDLVGNEPHEFLYGARITGGGSGGTVAVLGRRGQINAVAGVAERYRARTGYRPIIFSGSSPGANGFQHLGVIRK